MEKSITTAIFIMASVVAAVALINAVVPALGQSTSALVTANSAASERIKTDVEIIHVTGDDGANTVTIWVKNIGSVAIRPVNSTDIFLDTPTTVSRLAYEDGCNSGSSDCWDYSIEGTATEWASTETVKFTLTLSSLGTGVHSVRVAVFNGVTTDKDFSI